MRNPIPAKPDERYVRLALLLDKRRYDLGIKQGVMARRLGVSQSTLSCWERGLSMPWLHMLPSICAAFKIDPLELVHVLEYRPGDIKTKTVGRPVTHSSAGVPYQPRPSGQVDRRVS